QLPASCKTYGEAFHVAESWIERKVGEYGGYDLYDFGISTEDGSRLRLTCWLGSIVYTFLLRQYFFDRNGVVIAPERGDIILDIGACLGETALDFALATGKEGRVYSFDPL